METKTIFQKIIDREIPAEIIYEDDRYIAILDIFPKSKGHTLLLTKEPYPWVIDVPHFGDYWETAKRVALAIETSLASTYISFQTYGTEIPHAHIHIVPHYDMSEKRLERTQPTKEELHEVADTIRKAMQ